MGTAASPIRQTRIRATSIRGSKGFAWTASILLCAAVIGSRECVAYAPIYGSGTYLQVTGGYTDPDGIGSYYPYPIDQGTSVGDRAPLISAVNDSGVAVTLAYKYDYVTSASDSSLGARSLRWSSTVAPFEMATLNHGPATFNGAAPLSMNNSGVAVGQAYTLGANHTLQEARPVRWSADGLTATELGTFGTDADGHPRGAAFGVNASDTAVGFSYVYDLGHNFTGFAATRWDAGGVAVTALQAGAFASAYAINDSGVAVGYTIVTNQGNFAGDRATRWAPAPNTQVTVLGALGTGEGNINFSYAWDINSAGTAVGISDKFDGAHNAFGMRAVRWNAGTTLPTELGTIGSSAPGSSTLNFAYAINTPGTTVGAATKFDSGGNPLGVRPVRWDASGTAATELGILGTLPNGQTTGIANDINDNGFAVGRLENHISGGQHDAVYWRPDGTVVDLNNLIDPNLGWHFSEARHISNTRWITGWGYYSPDGSPFNQYTRAFLLQIPPDGDYNRNGVVDAADYVLWRKTLGQSVAIGTGADGDYDGQVTQSDYNVWRSQLGQLLVSGSGALSQIAVPEPNSCGLACILPMTAAARRRRVARP